VKCHNWKNGSLVAGKKSGEICTCCDLREVNKAIIVGKHPLSLIDKIFTEFAEAARFFKVDLRSGYLQVPLVPESRYLTAFIMHGGVFQYKQLPFGLASAPSAFQKIMDIVLSGLKGAPQYLDNITVHGKDKNTTCKAQNDAEQREICLQHKYNLVH
jgi:hypothetical protein